MILLTLTTHEPCSLRCVIVRIQALAAVLLFPGGQESSIYSPYAPKMCPIVRLLNVRFRLLLHATSSSSFMNYLLGQTAQRSSTCGNGINNNNNKKLKHLLKFVLLLLLILFPHVVDLCDVCPSK